jgi:hypothetical protein
MSDDNAYEINVFKCLDFLRDNAEAYAKAKAQRIYLEEFRKTKKALCMIDAERRGHQTVAAQEREAYADPEYLNVIEGLQAAVEEEERLRWLLIAAQAKIEAFRSIESSRRAETKNI